MTPEQPTAEDAALRPLPLALLAAVLALVAVVFWPALEGGFVYDDLLLVGQNPALHDVRSLTEALGTSYWDFQGLAGAESVGYWRPLTSLVLFAGRALGDGGPRAFHALSLALHLAAVVAAYLLAHRLLRNATAAWFTALLFGLHPAHVEPVAWISAVNDPLQGLFVLVGLERFVRWRERGSPGFPLGAALAFALGLLAKESAVAFVPLALALDFGRRDPGARFASTRERFHPFARAYGTLFLVLVAYGCARIAVFGDAGAGFDRVSAHLDLGLARQLTLRIELLGGFLGLLVWPASLHPFREIRPEIGATDLRLALAVLAIALWLAAFLWALRKSARPALAALLWMPLAVLPVLVRIESVGRFALSDRFLYLAAFGVAWLVSALALGRIPRALAWTLLAGLAGACAVHARASIPFWRDEESVFRGGVAKSPDSPYVQWGLGRVLLEKFRSTLDPAALREAYEAFTRSQDLGHADEHGVRDASVLVALDDRLQANLGVGWYHVLCALTMPQECVMEEAELVFGETARLFPESSHAQVGLAVARMHLGRLDEAEADLRRALELDPKSPQAWYDLGQLQTRRARWKEAADAFERARSLAPDDPETLVQLARARIETGETARAREALLRARELDPANAGAALHLGTIDARAGRYERALQWIEDALRSDGTFGAAHLQRGKVLVALGQVERALAAFAEACRLMPNELEPHYLLGKLLVQGGRVEDAEPYLARALEIEPEGPYAEELRKELERLRSNPK